jgi:hypothetical protein
MAGRGRGRRRGRPQELVAASHGEKRRLRACGGGGSSRCGHRPSRLHLVRSRSTAAAEAGGGAPHGGGAATAQQSALGGRERAGRGRLVQAELTLPLHAVVGPLPVVAAPVLELQRPCVRAVRAAGSVPPSLPSPRRAPACPALRLFPAAGWQRARSSPLRRGDQANRSDLSSESESRRDSTNLKRDPSADRAARRAPLSPSEPLPAARGEPI